MDKTIDSSATLQDLITIRFARPEPVSACPVEQNGIIIGGVIVIRGEKEFDQAKSLFPKSTKPATP